LPEDPEEHLTMGLFQILEILVTWTSTSLPLSKERGYSILRAGGLANKKGVKGIRVGIGFLPRLLRGRNDKSQEGFENYWVAETVCTTRCGKGISMPLASKASLIFRVISNFTDQ
jgi:hypothetical protein